MTAQTSLRKPPALRAGDRVAVVAPASPFAREEFDRGIAELRRLGFDPVFDESVFARRPHVAGEPTLRAEALRRAWSDPSIAGVIAVRGGYGSAQILPLLDVAELRRTPKVFSGYSDLTALLTLLTIQGGLVAFHGPMLDRRLARGREGYDADTFLRAVMRAEPLGELAPPGLDVLRPGEARGLLLGGTLTQICASLGTPYAFMPPMGSVLFLEDVGERPYRLDRMIVHLRQAGVLERASAIVWGELPGCDEPDGGPAARASIAEALEGFPGPVLFGFPSGHTAGPVWTLPLGVAARVVGRGTPRLVIEDAAVEERA